MTLATQHAEIDRTLLEHFEVHHCTSLEHPEDEFDLDAGLGLCFEFDYPDRPGLDLMRRTKERLPQVPILMITTHHSESLAIWAYRNRVFDYLVKPITADDIRRCHEFLTAIQHIEPDQRKRRILSFRSRIPSEIPAGQRQRHKRLAPALLYVDRMFRGKIRNVEVAELCDMSQYHFSHEFRQTFGLTFQEYVLRYRILEACRELKHPNVSVTSVAYSVGFNDPSYFARVFRRYVGHSPTEYCQLAAGAGHSGRLADILDRLELTEVRSALADRRRGDRRDVRPDRRQTGI